MWPYLAALTSALLLWAAFPPFGWGALAFVAPAPVLGALRRVDRAGQAFRVGLLFGCGFFGLLLIWILILGAVAWIPLTLVLGLFAALYAVLVWSVRLWPAWRWWLVVVGGWALWELVRARFPFGGFPWGSIGFAAGSLPGAIGSAQWIGATGWSVLAIAVAAGLVLVVEDTANWRHVVDPVAVVLLLVLGGSLLAPSADGATVRVAVVQGNSPCPMTHCQNENRRIYDSHLALTRALPEGRYDLVIWAENSTGGAYEPVGNEQVAAEITAEAERLGAYLLISGTRSAGPGAFLNVNRVYSPRGGLVGEYVKRHPVPFGEYVPLRAVLGFIPELDRVPRDMVRGDRAVVFDLDEGVLGTVISFEGAFARKIRSEVEVGAELLVVATNESSYGPEAPAADQFIAMTRMQAASVGMDLVHAAITGKSAVIRADGTVTAVSGLYTTEVLSGTVQFRTAGRTIYARFGDWLQYLAVALGVLAIAVPGEQQPGLRFLRPSS